MYILSRKYLLNYFSIYSLISLKFRFIYALFYQIQTKTLNAILKNYGEVYQYVGDEIVITWKLDKGLMKNHCVQCFFDMKTALSKQRKTFQKKYNTIPDFKAALHFGQVTSGEIGALKKDIFFTGDVLNTTARILGLTTALKEDLLISEPLSRKLKPSEKYSLEDLGNQTLKGKTKSIQIFAVNEIQSNSIKTPAFGS